jgi:hypothetical protein
VNFLLAKYVAIPWWVVIPVIVAIVIVVLAMKFRSE